jgi:hypothetical protein
MQPQEQPALFLGEDRTLRLRIRTISKPGSEIYFAAYVAKGSAANVIGLVSLLGSMPSTDLPDVKSFFLIFRKYFIPA